MTGQSCSHVTLFFITRVLTRTQLSRCSRTDCTRFVFQIIIRPFLRAANPEPVDAAALLHRELCSASSCFESRPGLQFRPSFRGFSRCLLAYATIVRGLWGGCFLRNSYQLSTYPTDYDETASFEILTNLSTYPTDYDAVASFQILTNLYIYHTYYDATDSFEILTSLSTYPTDYDETSYFEITTNLSTYPTDFDVTASFEILTSLYTYPTDYDATPSFEILSNLCTYPTDCDAVASFEMLTSLSTYPTDYDATTSFEILTSLSTYPTDCDAFASFEILTIFHISHWVWRDHFLRNPCQFIYVSYYIAT
jgi:hypothetical protein